MLVMKKRLPEVGGGGIKICYGIIFKGIGLNCLVWITVICPAGITCLCIKWKLLTDK
jgi:hypothetical protein